MPLGLTMQMVDALDEVDKFSADTHPPYGETGGAMLLMEDVTVSRGDRDLMFGVNMRLTAGERVGLVGPNGAGKSTLLSAASGRLPVMGKVLVRPGLSLGYLVQTAVSGSERSCWDEASSQMARLNRAQAALDDITSKIAAGDTSEESLNMQADALAAFEAAGGYNVDEKIASVLTGLGFEQKDFKKSCTQFSGGWQMKIALARLLLSEPDMLLLDEPTNHLDAKAKAWLGSYLAAYQGTVMIVTHEESLLNSAALTQVVEVRDQKANMFRGSYAKFLEERVNRVERQQKMYEEQQREIEHLEDYIRRFGAKFSHASQAQDKRKKLERIQAELIEAPTELETVEDRYFRRPEESVQFSGEA
jgi:ATP-binding cassette subfamily F protein 3